MMNSIFSPPTAQTMEHDVQAYKPSWPKDRLANSANPLLEKLATFVRFDERDVKAISSLTRRQRPYVARDTIVFQDSRQSAVQVILSGAAYRCRHLPNGQRQILGYLFAGDLCDANFVISNECDYDLIILTDALVAQIPLNELMDVLAAHPKIERSMLMATLVDARISREWLVNVGQRDGLQRLAHFFCEMAARLQTLGAANTDGSITIPVTQSELADTLGMTTVHVNRVLQRLRSEGLLVWKSRRLTILHPALLEQLAGFDRRYLELSAPPFARGIIARGRGVAREFIIDC
jgi:CRP-like cAMP-binding protein